MISDVKQEINQKAFTLLHSFFMLPYNYETSEEEKTDHQTKIECFTLMQELGRHLQWSEAGYSFLKQRKMSQTLHVNIFIYVYMVYFLCSNWSCKTQRFH